MRGLDRWIEGDTPRGASKEWRSPRPEPPNQAATNGLSTLKQVASPYANLSPTELLARLRASLGKDGK